LEPGRADVLAALGQVLARSGPVGALPAQAAFRAALACHPLPTRIHASVAAGLHESGDTAEAVAAFRNLIETHPEDPHGWSGLAKVVADGGGSDWGLSPDLLATMLEHPCVRPSALRRATLASLKADAGLAALVAAAERGERLEPAGEIATLLSGHRLLLTALPALPLCDVGFERLFTALRRGLVLGGLPAAALPFAVALAAQCQLVDYVWEEGADETAVGAAAGIVLLAAYRPLVTVAGVEKMAGIAEVFDLHVAQPLEERRLAAAMPRLTGRANAVSEGVRAQYEEFPYPRWRRPGLEPEKRSLDEIWGAIPAHPAPPQLDRPLEVLIAGCGTGQHALNSASIYGDARVLAVDISLASLAYAQRQTRALGVEGIEYAQADILELGGLERRFDVIECAGVLHHLADPLAGWRVLRRLVRDDGLMRIALYSRAARQAVAACRAFIAERGYKADLDGIRRCRQDILALPDGHPARPVIAFPDFHGANECRDLLFHVQEHTFTLPAIEAALAELNLCFLGFAAPAATRAFRAEFGDAADPLSLAAWHAFETEHPDAFVGMYDFWVAPAGGQP